MEDEYFKVGHWYGYKKIAKDGDRNVIKILACHLSSKNEKVFWLEWYNLKTMNLIDTNFFKLDEGAWEEIPEHLITFEMI